MGGMRLSTGIEDRLPAGSRVQPGFMGHPAVQPFETDGRKTS
jgi:hypothetical protein